MRVSFRDPQSETRSRGLGEVALRTAQLEPSCRCELVKGHDHRLESARFELRTSALPSDHSDVAECVGTRSLPLCDVLMGSRFGRRKEARRTEPRLTTIFSDECGRAPRSSTSMRAHDRRRDRSRWERRSTQDCQRYRVGLARITATHELGTT